MGFSIATTCIGLGRDLSNETADYALGSAVAMSAGIAIGIVELVALTAYICIIKVATFFIPGEYNKKFDDFLFNVVTHTGSVLAEMTSVFSKEGKESVRDFFASFDVARFSYVHIDGVSSHVLIRFAANVVGKNMKKIVAEYKPLLVPAVQLAAVASCIGLSAFFVIRIKEVLSQMVSTVFQEKTIVVVGMYIGAGMIGSKIGSSLSPQYKGEIRKKVESVFQLFSEVKKKIYTICTSFAAFRFNPDTSS